MKIGIVTNWSYSGATEVSITFGKVLNLDHEVYYYGRNEEFSFRESQEEFDITKGKFSGLPFPKAIDKQDFESWLKEKQIEIVLFNEQIWVEPVIWARNLGLRTVGYVDYYNEMSIPNFKVFDALISNTKRHTEVFSWHSNIWHLPWGLDTLKIQGTPSDFQSYVRTDFFHSAGSSPNRRGTDLLLEAFNLLGSHTLTVHSTKPLRDILPAQTFIIDKLIAEKRLQIIEKEEPLPGYYKLGRVYVYPNRLDGIGLTVVEALASGLPVICPDEQPMTDFVNQEVGYLVPVQKRWSRRDGYYWPLHEVSVDILAQTMRDSMSDEGDLFRMSKLAEESVKMNHDMVKNYSELPRLFRELKKMNVDHQILSSIIESRENEAFQVSNKWVRRLVVATNKFRNKFI